MRWSGEVLVVQGSLNMASAACMEWKSLEELPRLALFTAAVVELVVLHVIFGLSYIIMYFGSGLNLKCFLSLLVPSY